MKVIKHGPGYRYDSICRHCESQLSVEPKDVVACDSHSPYYKCCVCGQTNQVHGSKTFNDEVARINNLD